MSYRTIYHYNLPNGLTGHVDRFADGSYVHPHLMGISDAEIKEIVKNDPDMIDNGPGRGRYQFGPKFNTPRECMEYIESKGATLRKTEGRRS
jgi:hypothetical protein